MYNKNSRCKSINYSDFCDPGAITFPIQSNLKHFKEQQRKTAFSL